MAISKKLMALLAGVLLAGSFGLAGCDDSGSASGSSNTGTSNENQSSKIDSSNSGSNNAKANDSGKTLSDFPKDPKCEPVNDWYQAAGDGAGAVVCFGDSGVRMPGDAASGFMTMEEYNEYRYFFYNPEYCLRSKEDDYLVYCYTQIPDVEAIRRVP